MSRPVLPVLLAMSLLSLLGCSRTAKELPGSLADVRAEITVEHLTERGNDAPDFERVAATAKLYRANGAVIERDDLRIEMNGVLLEYRVGVGNYYDRHPSHRLNDEAASRISPATELRFTLVWPDGARDEIGTVRTPAALTLAQLDFPRTPTTDGKVTLAWRELAEVGEVSVYRANLRTEPDGSQVRVAGSPTDPAALRRTIGPGWWRKASGSWAISTEFLAPNDEGALSSLGAEIVVAREGKLTRGLAVDSSITATRRIVLRMDVPEAESLSE